MAAVLLRENAFLISLPKDSYTLCGLFSTTPHFALHASKRSNLYICFTFCFITLLSETLSSQSPQPTASVSSILSVSWSCLKFTTAWLQLSLGTITSSPSHLVWLSHQCHLTHLVYFISTFLIAYIAIFVVNKSHILEDSELPERILFSLSSNRHLNQVFITSDVEFNWIIEKILLKFSFYVHLCLGSGHVMRVFIVN